jgi:hypothetical protein
MARMDGVVVEDSGVEELIVEEASTKFFFAEMDAMEELLALYHVR